MQPTHLVSEPGWVFWITGLAGSGKTTIALQLLNALRSNGRPVILLDGDDLRAVMGEQTDYSIENRRKLAGKYGLLCKLIADQGIDVVCATISMFHDIRENNRRTIANYFEVFIDTPIDILTKRNKKNLYTDNASHEREEVILPGPDLEVPNSPDLALSNDGSESADTAARLIYETWASRENKS